MGCGGGGRVMDVWKKPLAREAVAVAVDSGASCQGSSLEAKDNALTFLASVFIVLYASMIFCPSASLATLNSVALSMTAIVNAVL